MQKQIEEDRFGNFTFPEQRPGSFMAVENKDNEYLIDRVAQKNYSYSGIKSFPIQDLALGEDQWRPRSDRSLEHLVTSEESIMHVRRRLLTAARELMEGQEPAGPHHPEGFKVHTARMSMPADCRSPRPLSRSRSRPWGRCHPTRCTPPKSLSAADSQCPVAS